MARYPNTGQVLWVAPVKGKVKKVKVKKTLHRACPYGTIETQKTISVKGNLAFNPFLSRVKVWPIDAP
jgi:hypothetical protein